MSLVVGRWSLVLSCLFLGGSLALAEPPQSAVPPPHTNRLAKETSPYLLQHAHNPVDWYPWGDEAFAKAKQRPEADLFIGRLFQLPLVSRHGTRVVPRCRNRRLLNEHFVCIKVDREERPDVDADLHDGGANL